MSNNIVLPPLTEEFQRKLLYHLFFNSTHFTKDVITELTPQHFTKDSHKVIYSLIKNYFETYNVFPNISNIKEEINTNYGNEIEKATYKNELLNIFNLKKENNDVKFIEQNLVRFIKIQMVSNFQEELSEMLQSGDLSKIDIIQDIYKKISHIGDKEDYGVNVFDADNKNVFSTVQRDPIPTGFKNLDKVITGLGKGKLGLILAPQGVGKTTILTAMATNAYESGKKVLHVIFDENEESEIRRLAYAKWSKVSIKEFSKQKELIEKRVDEFKKKHFKTISLGYYCIKRFCSDGMTVSKLKNWIIKHEETMGIKFEIIFVDYLDEIEPTKNKTGDIYNGQVEVVKSFRSMLVDLDIPGWSAIQAKKESNTKAVLDLNDVGGSASRIKKAQLIVGIARDNDMRKQGTATFNILKSNISGSGHVFPNSTFDTETLNIVLNKPEGGSWDINEDEDERVDQYVSQEEKKALSSNNIVKDDIEELIHEIDFN
jgi:replicative DNA helicase